MFLSVVQWPVVQRTLGALLMLFAATLTIPIAVGWCYQDGAVYALTYSLIIIFSLGLISWWPVRNETRELRLHDGFVIVTLLWSTLSIAGSLPFMLTPASDIRDSPSHAPLSNVPLPFIDAVFESVSGLTTTGATVIVGLDYLPHALLFYRQQLHLLGGMGIIVLAVAILPMLGIGGMQLYRAETPGPMKDEKLTPRIRDAAKGLWIVYIGLTAICACSYWLFGMNAFDAITHAFSTIATGGFANYDASMSHFNNSWLMVVSILFMLLSGINFSLHFIVLRNVTMWGRDKEVRAAFKMTKRTIVNHTVNGNPLLRVNGNRSLNGCHSEDRYERFRNLRAQLKSLYRGLRHRARYVKQYWNDAECSAYLLFIGSVSFVVVVYLLLTHTLSVDQALLHGIFQVVSLTTTTGFTTVEYFAWPHFLPVLLIFSGFVGGCAGSTAGGMKVIRFLLLFKQGRQEIIRLIHPTAQVPVKLTQRVVPERVIGAVWGFFAVYIMAFTTMLLLLMATGLDQVTAFSAVAACINTVGPGLGEVSANFAGINAFAKIVLSFAMLLGRLEIFTVLVLFTPVFWQR